MSETPIGKDYKKIIAAPFEAPNDDSIKSQNGSSESATHIANEFDDRSTITFREGAPWWHSQFNLMLCVFALLVFIALLLIKIIPEPQVQDQTSQPNTQTQSNTTVENKVTPWSENQKAQARRDSQEILSSLLDAKESLQKKQVVDWAPERFSLALDKASSGDELYKQQDFAAAISNYRTALDEMELLKKLAPEIVLSRINDGLKAIDDGKADLAKNLFEQALAIDTNNTDARLGLDRVQSLNQVMAMVETAKKDELNFLISHDVEDLLTAEQKLKQANVLDPHYAIASDGLHRVRGKIKQKRFKIAMSNGFKALFSARNSDAKSYFSTALKFKPGDPTATSAYKQSFVSNKTSSLNSVLNNAKALENSEDWQGALAYYQEAMKRDPNQIKAKLGQLRSRARAQLDERINLLLADTLSLSKPKYQTNAQHVLKDAKAIKIKGKKLSEQIKQLENALTQANTKIKVRLMSDSTTVVSLVKVGSGKQKLGKFDNKSLALKPGRYVLMGVRLGYQDTRLEIDILPHMTGIQTFTIECQNPISVGLITDVGLNSLV